MKRFVCFLIVLGIAMELYSFDRVLDGSWGIMKKWNL
jgi:hypothetical protein